MVDNHAARTSEQAPEVGGKRSWVSKVVIVAILLGLMLGLVFLT